MLCVRCLHTRRTSFHRDGVCDVCDPTIGPPASPDGALRCHESWIEAFVAFTRADPNTLTDDQSAFVLACRQKWVDPDDYAICARVYDEYSRVSAAETQPDPPTGMWLGEPKQRLDIHGCQCTEARSIGVNPEHPEWGERWLIKFTAASGHELTWFASEGGKFDPKVGETYNIRATVVKHDEYNGRRSTIINRPAVIE